MPLQFTHTIAYPSVLSLIPVMYLLLLLGLYILITGSNSKKKRHALKESTFKIKGYRALLSYIFPIVFVLICFFVMTQDVLRYNNKLMVGFTDEGIYLHANAINELTYVYIPWDQLCEVEHKIIKNRSMHNKNRNGVKIHLTPQKKHQIIVSFNSAELCLVSDSSSYSLSNGSYILDVMKREKFPEKSCILESYLDNESVNAIFRRINAERFGYYTRSREFITSADS